MDDECKVSKRSFQTRGPETAKLHDPYIIVLSYVEFYIQKFHTYVLARLDTAVMRGFRMVLFSYLSKQLCRRYMRSIDCPSSFYYIQFFFTVIILVLVKQRQKFSFLFHSQKYLWYPKRFQNGSHWWRVEPNCHLTSSSKTPNSSSKVDYKCDTKKMHCNIVWSSLKDLDVSCRCEAME